MSSAEHGLHANRGESVSGGTGEPFAAAFSDTLRFQRSGARDVAARWLGVPIGVAAHALALAVFLLAALYTPSAPEAPARPQLLLQVAPPPPPPLRRGTDLVIEADRATTASEVARTTRKTSLTAPVSSIPEGVLAPSFELQLGSEEGFDDGVAFGMTAGVPGGVTGGVPGGLVGGVVGGTGRAVPRLPKADVGPSPIRVPQPSYTREAIRENVRGEVVLQVIIDERGEVQVLKVLRSVPGLDEEAIRVVESRWRFQPATKNGRPVPALSHVRVRFNLH